MTILAFPNIAPNGAAPFRNLPVSISMSSPIGGWTQTKGTPGATFWQCQVTFKLWKTEDASYELESFLGRVGGMTGRFAYGDPWYLVTGPRGPLGGAPLVKGAGQVGSSLVIEGATPSLTPWIKNGDYCSWAVGADYEELHRVIADANSDAGGEVTLNIIPPIRRSPDHQTPLKIAGATCVMMLASDDAFELARSEAGHLTASVAMVEAPFGAAAP